MNDGGPAFPFSNVYTNTCGDIETSVTDGLTKRQWFAGMVLQGLCSDGQIMKALSETSKDPAGQIVLLSYQFADAMLAESEKAAEGEGK